MHPTWFGSDYTCYKSWILKDPHLGITRSFVVILRWTISGCALWSWDIECWPFLPKSLHLHSNSCSWCKQYAGVSGYTQNNSLTQQTSFLTPSPDKKIEKKYFKHTHTHTQATGTYMHTYMGRFCRALLLPSFKGLRFRWASGQVDEFIEKHFRVNMLCFSIKYMSILYSWPLDITTLHEHLPPNLLNHTSASRAPFSMSKIMKAMLLCYFGVLFTA